jgi:protein gp37
MAENSHISWTDHTFNPWMGCTKVSPACKNCYAERDMDHRYGKVSWGPTGTRVLTSDANWRKPIQWNAIGQRQRVFCTSLADVFEDWDGPMLDHKGQRLWHTDTGKWQGSDHSYFAPVTMRDVRHRLFQLIDATPNLDWLLLTKRPENIQHMWPCICCNDDGTHAFNARYRKNVWLGTSVENQVYANKRITSLLECRDLAPVLFLSCEPLVGSVNLRLIGRVVDDCTFYDNCLNGFRAHKCGGSFGPKKIDWVITGGESGPEARSANPDWFRSLRDQCSELSVPFHFKQWGEFDAKLNRVGVKVAGRALDGVEHDAFPDAGLVNADVQAAGE